MLYDKYDISIYYIIILYYNSIKYIIIRYIMLRCWAAVQTDAPAWPAPRLQGFVGLRLYLSICGFKALGFQGFGFRALRCQALGFRAWGFRAPY